MRQEAVVMRSVTVERERGVKPLGPPERRLSLRVIALAAAFAGVVLGGTTAWWGFPPVALAAGCNNMSYHDTGAMRTNGVLSADRGVRASVEDHVYPDIAECAHVDSVLVEDYATLDFVEVGWGTFQPAYGNCSPASGMNNAPVVMFALKIFGVFGCSLVTSISIQGGDTPFVAVKSNWPSHPYDWIFSYNGNQLAYAGGPYFQHRSWPDELRPAPNRSV